MDDRQLIEYSKCWVGVRVRLMNPFALEAASYRARGKEVPVTVLRDGVLWERFHNNDISTTLH